MKRLCLLLLLVGCSQPADSVPMPDAGWESIGASSSRLEVPRGWIVITRAGYGRGICFVPDEAKEWKRR